MKRYAESQDRGGNQRLEPATVGGRRFTGIRIRHSALRLIRSGDLPLAALFFQLQAKTELPPELKSADDDLDIGLRILAGDLNSGSLNPSRGKALAQRLPDLSDERFTRLIRILIVGRDERDDPLRVARLRCPQALLQELLDRLLVARAKEKDGGQRGGDQENEPADDLRVEVHRVDCLTHRR